MTAVSLRSPLAAGAACASGQELIRVDPSGTAPLALDDMAGLLRAIGRACPDRSTRIIQVIGSLHGEGASSVARALAYTATVIDGASALVCDATTNQDSLRQFGDAQERPTLCDIIDNPGNLAAAISPARGMSYALCCLARPDSHAHPAIRTDRLGLVLDTAREIFDWIIIDSPPASAGSFGPTLARVCDGSVLVAQEGHARVTQVTQTARTVELYGGRVLGVVLNKVGNSGRRRGRRT